MKYTISGENNKNIKTVISNNTRTLADALPRLATVKTNGQIEITEFLKLAASLEKPSEHAIGTAISQETINRNLELFNVKDFYVTIGRGVCGEINGKAILIGNEMFMIDAGLEMDLQKWNSTSQGIHQNGETVLYVAIEGEITGLLGLTYQIQDTLPMA